MRLNHGVALTVLLLAGCSDGSGSSRTLTRPSSTASSGEVITSILTPRATAASADALRTAAEILRQRLQSLSGTRDVKVQVVGEHLEVQADALGTVLLKELLAAGRLEFRRVVELEPIIAPAPQPSGAIASRAPLLKAGGQRYSAEAFSRLDCSGDKASDPFGAAGEEIVACAKSGAEKYHLAVAKVVGGDLKGASSGPDSTGTQAQINLQFTASGQGRWTALTQETFQQPAPTNQLAIVLDGVVISAPVIQAVITGDAQITGSFTVKESEALAATLRFGALPLSFDISRRQ